LDILDWIFWKKQTVLRKAVHLKTDDGWSLNCFIKFGFMTTQVLC
jgi:hypothetical protein